MSEPGLAAADAPAATVRPPRALRACVERAKPSREQVRSLVAGSGLFGRFGYLVLTQGVVLVLGLAYWTTTTRLVPAHSVGVSAAAVSVAALLSALGVLGIGSLLLVELRTVPKEAHHAVVSTAILVAAAAALVLALLTWAASPLLGHSLSELGRSPVDASLFVVGTVMTTMAGLLDSVAIGLRKGPAQLVRNGTASALRLVLIVLVVFALGARDTTGLLIAWAVSLSISLLLCPRLLGLARPETGRTTLAQRWEIIWELKGAALRHHALNLAITSVTFFLPFLAALFLLPRDFAYFSVAQLVASMVLLVPALLAMSLFAEASDDVSSLQYHVRRTLPFGLACCAAALVVIEPAAPLLLGVFGRDYAEHGTDILRILLLAGIPYVIKDHFVAIRRAQRKLTSAAKVVSLATCLEAAAAAVGAALFGVLGLCGFWVAATMLEALYFAPVVWSVARGEHAHVEVVPDIQLGHVASEPRPAPDPVPAATSPEGRAAARPDTATRDPTTHIRARPVARDQHRIGSRGGRKPHGKGADMSETALVVEARRIGEEVADLCADEVDREARFPIETVTELRKSGLSGALVPAEWGGVGAGLGEISQTVSVIAQHCASSALVLAMHHIQVAMLVRHASPAAQEALLPQVAAGELLLANANSEVGLGGNRRTSICALEPTETGYRIEKEAATVSYGEYADGVLATARRSPDSLPNDQVLAICLPPDLQLEPRGEWDTLGLRGTCSRPCLLLADIPDEMVIHDYADVFMRTSLPVSSVLLSSVWLGLAEAGGRQAHAAVRSQARKSRQVSPDAPAPISALRLAELSVVLHQLREVVAAGAADYERNKDTEAVDTFAFSSRMDNLKLTSTTLVLDIVQRAMLICGLPGFANRSPVSMARILRDAAAAPLMVNNDRALQAAAELLLIRKEL